MHINYTMIVVILIVDESWENLNALYIHDINMESNMECILGVDLQDLISKGRYTRIIYLYMEREPGGTVPQKLKLWTLSALTSQS